MIVDAIQNGIVFDHIQAGRGMELYRVLKLKERSCTVALLLNVDSRKMGKKDIIKVDEVIDLNLDVIGYIDPGITVNIIRDGKVIKQEKLELPERVEGVIHCRNPRCITSTEQELPQVFTLTDRERHVYRCLYCESKAK